MPSSASRATDAQSRIAVIDVVRDAGRAGCRHAASASPAIRGEAEKPSLCANGRGLVEADIQVDEHQVGAAETPRRRAPNGTAGSSTFTG